MSKLAEACALSFEEWISTFPETMPKAECSPQHEKWKKKLFNKMRNDRYHVLTTKSIKIMLVAAILCALLMSAFSFPSSREGFELESSSYVGKNLFNRYEDNNGDYYTVSKSSSSINVKYNTENTETTEIIVNGTKYLYCQSESGVNSIIWTKYDYVYRVNGRQSLNSLLEIAQSVE